MVITDKKNESVRATAAEAAGNMGAGALPVLKKAINDEVLNVRIAAVKAAGRRYLNEGDKLEFTLEDGPKGPSAVNLKKLD